MMVTKLSSTTAYIKQIWMDITTATLTSNNTNNRKTTTMQPTKQYNPTMIDKNLSYYYTTNSI